MSTWRLGGEFGSELVSIGAEACYSEYTSCGSS
jgi:hypothetical protein